MILVAYNGNKMVGIGRAFESVVSDATISVECETATAPTSFKLFVWNENMTPVLKVTRITDRGIIE